VEVGGEGLKVRETEMKAIERPHHHSYAERLFFIPKGGSVKPVIKRAKVLAGA